MSLRVASGLTLRQPQPLRRYLYSLLRKQPEKRWWRCLFLRLHKTVPLGPSAGQETTLLGIIDITSEVGEGGLRTLPFPHVQLPNFSAANAPLTLTLKVSFTGLQAFAINPDSWFAEAAIKIYQRGLVQQDRDTFFGSNGVLSRRIFQVILGFQPTLTIIPENQTVFESLSRSYLERRAVGDRPKYLLFRRRLLRTRGKLPIPNKPRALPSVPSHQRFRFFSGW